MKLFVLKKLQGRKYDSEDLLRKVLRLSGLEDAQVFRAESGRLGVSSPDGGTPLHVSVSHTPRCWVCLTDTAGPVGVDIEEKSRKIRPRVLGALHPLERESLSGLESGSAEWNHAFLDIWTRKESYAKYLGSGLARGFSSFSVLEASGVPAKILPGEEGALAFIQSLPVSRDLQLAFCASHAEDGVEILALKDPGRPLRSAEEQAAELLARRDYTAKDLKERLIGKGHDPREAAEAVSRAMQAGYLDDENFALRYAQRALDQGKGMYRVVRELVQKGLEEEQAKALVGELWSEQMESEGERAFRLARIMLEQSEGSAAGAPLSQKTIGKIARRLSFLGYEPSLIYGVLERLRP